MTTLKLVEPAEPEAEIETYEYDEGFQEKIAGLVMRDTVFAGRTDGLIRSEYFENTIDGALVKLALDHFKVYKQIPDRTSWVEVIKDAIKAKKIRGVTGADIKDRFGVLMKAPLADRELVIDKVADFARDRACEAAIIKCVDLKAKGDYAACAKIMAEAAQVGASSASSTYCYWDEIENRTTYRKDLLAGTAVRNGITTGIKELDQYLYHLGWGRKELSVLMGAAKAGKSMSLGDFAKNASLAGFNVLYVTLEVSAAIIADRTDANVSSTPIKDVGGKPFDVETKIKAMAAKGKLGLLNFEEFPSGMFTPGMLRRLIETHRTKGWAYDLIVVDYADIMAPDHRSDQERENLRDIYLQLRAIAFEQNAAMLTATQTNREGAKSATAKMTDVAEDFNKVRTADILISLNSTEPERAAGEARLYFAAHRNGKSDFTLRIKQDRSRMQFITKVIAEE